MITPCVGEAVLWFTVFQGTIKTYFPWSKEFLHASALHMLTYLSPVLFPCCPIIIFFSTLSSSFPTLSMGVGADWGRCIQGCLWWPGGKRVSREPVCGHTLLACLLRLRRTFVSFDRIVTASHGETQHGGVTFINGFSFLVSLRVSLQKRCL